LGEKNSARATLCVCEKNEGKWAEKFRVEAHVGARGIALPRTEGSRTTPAGVYGLGPAFGIADDPGSILPYEKLRPGDFWIVDPKSKHYNRFVRNDFSDRDWTSAEDLYAETVAYKYALVIRYNAGPVVPGAGSAIFLHCSRDRPTAGCVAVSEEAMKKILAFADDDTRILIAESAARLLSF
ncbi:L,D-transpeptidase family protein, partial [Synergistaceae bacterium OttesenSCG-928-I11]|nr:L,D-transpeptidase family protein [Synergistaceae bacterium OttesenSCG-928-I11]